MAVFTADPFTGLFLVVDREYTKDNGHRQAKVKLQHTICDGLAYIIKMRRISTYNAAQRDKRIRFLLSFGVPKSSDRKRDLYCTWNRDRDDLLDVMLLQAGNGAFLQFANNSRIPFSFHQNDTGILDVQNACVDL